MPNEANDPVLLAIDRAPVVPITAEEEELLNEAERLTSRWLTSAEFAAGLDLQRREGTEDSK